VQVVNTEFGSGRGSEGLRQIWEVCRLMSVVLTSLVLGRICLCEHCAIGGKVVGLGMVNWHPGSGLRRFDELAEWASSSNLS